MIFSRNEIMPGVALNCLTGDKFKTSLFTVSLLSQLTREDASSDAAVVSVLSRGSSSYPDMEKLSARMEELYGSGVNPTVRKTGEIHSVGFASYFQIHKNTVYTILFSNMSNLGLICYIH